MWWYTFFKKIKRFLTLDLGSISIIILESSIMIKIEAGGGKLESVKGYFSL